MKTIYKIVILLLVFCGLVSAISVFYATRVSMPEIEQDENPHLEYLRRHSFAVIGLKKNENFDDRDSTEFLQYAELEDSYKRQLLYMKRSYMEGLITSSQYNGQLDTFICAYSWAFAYMAHNIFKEREWSVYDRNFLVSRVSELNGISDNDGIKVIIRHEEQSADLDCIVLSCQDYSKAMTMLSQTQYNGFSSVESRIDEIDDLIDRGFLNLNDYLIDEMKLYPTRLGDSHYEYIKNLASCIENWRSYTLETTLSNFEKLANEADTYTNNGEIYKGDHPKDMSDILSSAKSNKKEAVDELSTLFVDDYSGEVTKYLDNSYGEVTLYITTNHPDGYQLTATASEWFSIKEKGNGWVTVSYNANNSQNSRNDYFNVVAGNKSVKVKLVQEAKKYSTYNHAFLQGKKYYIWDSTPGANKRITVSVTPSDYSYDFDLYILDANGNTIAKEATSSHSATVTFTTPSSGSYKIKVLNYTSGYGCYYDLREQEQ